jgi:hypothetical protein
MNPKHTLALAMAVLGAPLTHPVLAEPCSLSALGWMAGAWHDAANPRGSQEQWVAVPGAVLMGSAWSFPPDGKPGFAEIMTVRHDGAGIVMVLRHFDVSLSRAWEEREAPMMFSAAQCTERTAVFDGLGARAGEHLSYERSGDRLRVVGDFLHNGKAVRVEWQMNKSSD